MVDSSLMGHLKYFLWERELFMKHCVWTLHNKMDGYMISASIYFTFQTFCSTFSGIYVFYVIIYAPIFVLCLKMVL